VLALLPLWNASGCDRRLVADDVVQTPRAALLDEVGADADAVAFHPAQLDVYGVYRAAGAGGAARDYDAQKATYDGLARWPTRSRRRSSGRRRRQRR